MKLLVTGGAGYIGSHTIVELLQGGHDIVAVDNLSNSSAESLKRVAVITGRRVPLYVQDIRDTKKLNDIFIANQFDAVLHFAGLKAVGESVAQPLRYYQTNIGATLSLCEVMQAHGVKRLVFSSSATVYDTGQPLPWRETSRTGGTLSNPYGRTKYMVEQILQDLVQTNTSWEVTILRYFNPIGAHPSGLIGEDPAGVPNNLLPYISHVASGKLEKLRIFGNDYNTPDGTCVRDYIHVVDLARGHTAALDHLKPGAAIYNLGTGKGVSVLELVHAFEKASGKIIPYEIGPRRPGDPACYFADCTLAGKALGWKATKSIAEACADAWRWQSQNSFGYSQSPNVRRPKTS